ncbi:hypothetical protein [Moorena sp. SIO3H5]|uniref:hypothetical protein n=1 Tax=Moorena sp. SIO3H5 TaxID=2607834 RepID=UPI0013BD3BD4|nr:hypothetical protein [Moorena sp. SIO3H5]NEO70154.1 hypothetical protein [Moorena sp. SIO3H5]
MGILVEQASCLFDVPASWWNRNLGGTGILPVSCSSILVEQASCLFDVPASWWNRHLACFMFQHLGRTGILPVSSSSGQDAHSTAIGFIPERARCPLYCYWFHSRAGKMPTLLNWLFPIPDSLDYPNTS